MDGMRADRFDSVGAVLCLVEMAVIMRASRLAGISIPEADRRRELFPRMWNRESFRIRERFLEMWFSLRGAEGRGSKGCCEASIVESDCRATELVAWQVSRRDCWSVQAG